MKKEVWYITDEQINIAREKGACSPALEWAKQERDWRKITLFWLEWDAENTHLCPAEVLELFSKDSNWHVRYWVAQHPNTPAEALIKLSKDSIWDIRYEVARNPNTPAEALVELSEEIQARQFWMHFLG